MKISILGKGLAGCYTAAHFQNYSPQDEIELIFDSKIPPVPIGQATVLDSPEFLHRIFGLPELNWYNNPIKATAKTGILYENWGTKNDKHFHPFPFHMTGLHYDTVCFQDYVCEKGGFKVIDKNILDYKEIDSDYIFDCRGFPTNYDNYDMLVNPLNTALLSRSEEVKPEQRWTRAVATPNGWTFDIPLTDHTSLGYLYNSDITSDEDATENFNEMFNNPEIYKKMKFKNYIAKEPIIDERIILNGNKLFFLEPLESTAISVYITWIRICFGWIIEKDSNSENLTNYIKNHVRKIQNFILYHYGFGSKWSTPFWEYAKTLKITDSEFWKFMNYAINLRRHWTTPEYEKKHYGIHAPFSFKNQYEGLNNKEV